MLETTKERVVSNSLSWPNWSRLEQKWDNVFTSNTKLKDPYFELPETVEWGYYD
jgi:hypothetical protein